MKINEKMKKVIKATSIHSLTWSWLHLQTSTTMDAKLHHLLSSTPASPTHLALTKPSPTKHNHIFSRAACPRPLRISTLVYNTTGSDGGGSTSSPDADGNSVEAPDAMGVRFKKRSRRRTKQQLEEGGERDGGRVMKAQASAAPKKWEDMSLGEKALELYVGEKGALFWLNKFAYASIYVVIGALDSLQVCWTSS